MRSLLLLAVLCSLAAAAEAAPDLRLTNASFVAERTGDDEEVIATATTHLPYDPDRSCYRRTLRFAPGEGEVRVRELFELPGRTAYWAEEPGRGHAVSPDRAAAITDLLLGRSTGELTNLWCVATGDPRGEYRISVVPGKRLLHRFVFTVGEVPRS